MGGSILLAMLLAIGAPEVQAGDLEGRTTRGKLASMAAETVTLETPDGDVAIPFNRLLYVVPQPQPVQAQTDEKPTAWIELIDGSKLKAVSFIVQKNKAKVGASPGIILEIPTSAIRTVRFSDPENSQSALWPVEVGKGAAADMLSVRTKDGVDFLEGVLGDITDQNVEFKIQGETVPAKRTKIDGLIYFHKAADKLPEPTCVIDDLTGWRLKAKRISLDGDTLELMTLSGVSVRRPWSVVSRIDFSAGKVVYLSDLQPEKVQWTPYLDLGSAAPAMAKFYALRHDEGREHEPLKLCGKVYARGLALASRTEMVYRLPTGIKKFKATAGIDDSVRELGRVRLTVAVDGKNLFDQSISGRDAPVDVDLDLTGARRLSILVDYDDDSDVGDFLDLADARMLK